MVLIARVSFPRRHLNQAVTTYTGLPPVPTGVIRTGPFFQVGAEQVHAITIFTLPDEYTEETLIVLKERSFAFAAIPDFSCDFQEWREFREFLAGWVD